MDKKHIKEKVREALSQINEKEKTEKKSSEPKKKETKTTKTDYSEIQRKLKGTMLKANQVMAAAGLGDPDNATDRSLFGKKLHKDKNEEGGVYQFSPDDLAAITKVVNNPASYVAVGK